MNKAKLAKTAALIATAALTMGQTVMAASGTTAQSADNGGVRQTIPMKASVTSSYTVSIPADYGGSGGLTLTRDHNNQISTSEDTNLTFYGLLKVGADGVLEDGKEIVCNISTGDGLAKDTQKTEVGVLSMKTGNSTDSSRTALIENVPKIWSGDSSAVAQNGIAVSNFRSTKTGEEAGSLVWTNAHLSGSDSDKERTALLRTTLPETGTWTGSLVLEFGLGDATP